MLRIQVFVELFNGENMDKDGTVVSKTDRYIMILLDDKKIK